MQPVMETITSAFELRGSRVYGGEDVTQLEHALQSAHLAVQERAEASLVTASLLHDIGHILGEKEIPDDCQQNLDDHHETRGYAFLKQHFGDAVADPVRLHVAAKRYLCTTQPDYLAKLSPTSLKSYHDQGGEMSEAERQVFEAEPYFEAAVRLRHWDDAAKDATAKSPPLVVNTRYVQQCLSEKM